MAMTCVKVEGYTILRIGTPGTFMFEVWRNIGDKSYKTATTTEYFMDAARYVAKQKGIDDDFQFGYCEALSQVYWNN
jgi:hypothetical protein